MKFTYRQQKIIEILKNHPNVSISEIRDFLNEDISQPTLNRDLAKLVELSAIEKTGKARAIRYRLSTGFMLFEPIDLDEYFAKEIDFRNGNKHFNNEIFSVIEDSQLFSTEEEKYLVAIKDKYSKNIKDIPVTIYQKELERLTIDLSWKSS